MENNVFQISQHKASKYYRCPCCNGIILKDEVYNKLKYVTNNKRIKTLKIHTDCEVKDIVTLQ